MTLRRFINRDGWEKWIDVDIDSPVHITADRDDLPQGLAVNDGMAMRRASYRRREFHLVEWLDKAGKRGELIYVEDYDTSLLRDRSLALPAAAAIARIASIVDAPGEEASQLDRVADVLLDLPIGITRRSADRCYAHTDCRLYGDIGRACLATAKQPRADPAR